MLHNTNQIQINHAWVIDITETSYNLHLFCRYLLCPWQQSQSFIAKINRNLESNHSVAHGYHSKVCSSVAIASWGGTREEGKAMALSICLFHLFLSILLPAHSCWGVSNIKLGDLSRDCSPVEFSNDLPILWLDWWDHFTSYWSYLGMIFCAIPTECTFVIWDIIFNLFWIVCTPL